MSGIDEKAIGFRRVGYVATCLILCSGFFLLRDRTWRIASDLHTLMEWIAAMLALCVGALALMRFYSKKDNTFLFIGTGFVVTGLIDAYHAAITSDYFIDMFAAAPTSHLVWSWFASRIFLPALLWLSWIFWQREERLGAAGRVSEHLVYWGVALSAVGLSVIFAFIPLRDAYYPAVIFARPQELIPAFFFLLALIGYFRKGKWKTDPFEHWLIMGMIVGLMSQALFMSSSRHAYDVMFGAAHVLKIISYLCAFVGLLFNMKRLFSESNAHQELSLKNIILTTQQETSQDAILVVDEDATIISYNQRFVELWRLPEEMVRRGDDGPVLKFVVGQVANPEAFLVRVKYLYENRSEKSIEEIALKDGRIIDRYSAPMIGADGQYYGRIWYFRDITAKKRSEQVIRESEEKFRGLVEQSLVGIALIEEGRFSYVNHKFADIFGYGVEEILLLEPVDTVVEVDKPIIAEIIRRNLDGDAAGNEFTFQGLRKNGAVVDVEGRGARMDFGGKPVLMIILLDITERTQAEREVQILQAQLREQAIRDPLTGLYNRRFLDEAINRELARAERSGSPLSLVMGDIDNFKAINDSYGHLAGDEVLRVFGEQMKRNSRGSDIICRYGGEEFLLVLPDMSQAGAYARAEQLRKDFADTSIKHDASVIHATASFGVTTFKGHGQNRAELIAAADKALYASKYAGRNKVTAFAA